MRLVDDDGPKRSIRAVRVGEGVVIRDFVNLYECEIGDGAMIGTFVEIQKGVVVGRRCRVQSHSFLCEGVLLEDDVFVGHGVMFINDRTPRVGAADWTLEGVVVERGASIGSNATIMGGVTIGAEALVGAGAVVTGDVAPGTTVVGNPARPLGQTELRDS